MFKKNYFVSYFYNKGKQSGYGNCNCETFGKIRSYKKIEGIIRDIEQCDNFDQVIILNFIKL